MKESTAKTGLKPRNARKCSYSICLLAPAHLVGLAALQTAFGLAFFDTRFAIIPLAAFLVLCFAAPFIQRLRFYLPIVRRGSRDRPVVAITFDDGPDPNTTLLLLDLLSRHATKATFFLVGQKVSHYPELARQILVRGHEIGNHSYTHEWFLMLRGPKGLRDEIVRCQEALRPFGINPLAFRPPVGITNPYLFGVLIRLGMYCAGFSRRGPEFGNRHLTDLAKRILRRVRAGDVILLHDCSPPSGVPVKHWLEEIDQLLVGIGQRGLKAAPLSEVIRRPVMETASKESEPNPVQRFYDGLADDYDEEQDRSSQSLVRRTESDIFLKRLPHLLHHSDVALELGAGTGRFTLPIAQNARKVLAVDLSRRMLEILERKAVRAGLSEKIETCQGDIGQFSLEGIFDFMCAFSCFEYVADLEGMFRRLQPHLKIGGTFYFTVARCSLPRLFTQVGNAMRQGVWLHAVSGRKITRLLKYAGFSSVEVSSHALKFWGTGGVLLEVIARN
jgi:peptidoglycan-N-acetylglucosamine deacetylase